MDLAVQLQYRQGQSLAITAQVIQSIKLLQYSQEELQSFLSEQVERNPLIDIASEDRNGSMVEERGPLSHEPSINTVATDLTGERLKNFNCQSGNHLYRQTSDRNSHSGATSTEYETHNLEEYCASSISLSEYLRTLMTLTLRSKVELTIATEIVGSLDDDGYLRRSPSGIANKLGVTLAEVETIVQIVQSCSPTGVAARNLAECLRLQLRERGPIDPAMDLLLDNLSLLADYEFQKLEKICGVKKDAILKMANEIRKLNPRPGRQFDNEPILPVCPDILVETRRDGTFAIGLNPDCLPRLLVNLDYYSEVSENCVGEREKRFVTECLNSANWLAKNLDRRAKTILQVATEIVARQREFLLHGVAHLKPLTLKDVAEAVGMHESTVSRATSNKYMMTNRGMYELKFFFTNPIGSFDGGAQHSAESIHHMIKNLIDVEVADRALSDEAIADALGRKGVNIARRTVAKYRETMHIPSSQQRRRQKMAQKAGLTETVYRLRGSKTRLPAMASL